MFQGKISAPARVYCRQPGMFALTLPALLLTAASAFAQCTPAAPVNNTTVTCTGVRVNNATITNDGLITGNEGIVFRNAGATGSVVNSGTITGTGGIAIDYGLNGSANPFTLTLEPGSVINGKVMSTVATTGLDTFQLGGSGNGTFDASTLGPGLQYVGFSVFNKIGSSTWTLTGNSSFSGATRMSSKACSS